MFTAMSDIQDLVQGFAEQLAALIEAEAMEKAKATVMAAFGNDLRVGRRNAKPSVASVGPKGRRTAPLQLCPVPGCKNAAAPIFGMVCAKHKDVSKAKIKKYREARRLAKKKGKTPGKARKRSSLKRTARPLAKRATAKKVTRKPTKVSRKPKRARKVAKRAVTASTPTTASQPTSASAAA